MDLLLTLDEIPSDLLEYFQPRHEGNKGDVWKISTRAYRGAHFATFPPELVAPCVLAGTSQRGVCSHRETKLKLRQDLSLEKLAEIKRYLENHDLS